MTVLLYQQDQRGVAHVTLDRPEVHNAFNEELIAAITDAFRDIASSTRIRLVVLQANGPSFCAGADLDWMRRAAHFDDDHNRADADLLSTMLDVVDRCPKPVIAAVDGPAYGGGAGLVACADIAVATEQARFMLSGARLGVTPAPVSPYLVRAIGARQARRYMLTGETIAASEALALGLVHKVVHDTAALTGAMRDLEALLMKGAPGALAEAKRLVDDVANRPVTYAMQADMAERLARQRASVEGREGMTAFLAKRPPNWVTG